MIGLCHGHITAKKLHLELDGSKPMAYVESIAIKDEKGQRRDYPELQELVKSELINSFKQHLEKAIQYWQQPKSFVLDNPTFLDLMIKDQIDKRNMDFAGTMEEFIDSSDGNVRNEYTQNYKMVYSVLNHFLLGMTRRLEILLYSRRMAPASVMSICQWVKSSCYC